MKSSKFLFPSTIILAVGIYITDVYSIAFIYSVPLLILSIILGLFFFYGKNENLFFISVLLVVLFTGCILTNTGKTIMLEKAAIISHQGFSTFKAKVVKPEEPANSRIRAEMKVLEVNGEKSVAKHNIKILAIYDPQKLRDGTTHFKPGQIVAFSGIILPPSPADNPWEFDYKRYLNLNGISTVVLIPSPEKVIIEGEEKQGIIERTVFQVREKLRHIISHSIPSPESDLMLGILLGKRKELPKDLENSFRRAGTIHILAASGLHISIVMAFFILLFKKLKLNKAAIHLLTIIPVIFYALLAGGSPSIVRASIMGVLFLLASAVEKDYNPLRSLFFSAFILLVINPFNLFNTSFQMSFSAVAGIIILYPFILSFLPSRKDLNSILKQKFSEKIASGISGGFYFFITTIVISISAQLALMPILAYYFNEVSLVNLPANLILIPLTSVILPLGFTGGFIGMLFYPLGKFILVYSFIPLKIAVMTASLLGGSPFSSITTPSPTPTFIILYYSFLLAMGLQFPSLKRNRKTVILVLIVIACIYTISSAYKSLNEQKIVVFDTKHSSSIFVNHKNKSIIAIRLKGKMGSRSLKEIEWKVVSFLKKQGISKVDILMISCSENNDPSVIKEIFRLTPAKHLIISYPPDSENKPQDSLSSFLYPGDYSLIYDRDFEFSIKDTKFFVKKSGCGITESISLKWESGHIVFLDIENQNLKTLYRSDELINNIILIVETQPSDMTLIDRMRNQSGENAFLIDLSNFSTIKIRNLKKSHTRINNKTGNGKRLISRGAIIFDVSSLKIHQVNSDKINQEK